MNLFGAKKVLINKLLVSEEMLRGKFLVSNVILDNKILCSSMSLDKISGKQKQNGNSNFRVDDTRHYVVCKQIQKMYMKKLHMADSENRVIHSLTQP